MQVVIPFRGFYNTGHDDILDEALNSLIQDEAGDPRPELENLWESVPWGAVHNAYSKWYVEQLRDMFPVLATAGLTHNTVESPREYNFTNDLIIGDLVDPQVLWDACDKDILAKLVKDAFTPCSGFIPYFSADIANEKWARPLEEWAPVQLRFLIEAAMRSSDDWDEDNLTPWGLAEWSGANGNCVVEDMIYSMLPVEAQARLKMPEDDVYSPEELVQAKREWLQDTLVLEDDDAPA